MQTKQISMATRHEGTFRFQRDGRTEDANSDDDSVCISNRVFVSRGVCSDALSSPDEPENRWIIPQMHNEGVVFWLWRDITKMPINRFMRYKYSTALHLVKKICWFAKKACNISLYVEFKNVCVCMKFSIAVWI